MNTTERATQSLIPNGQWAVWISIGIFVLLLGFASAALPIVNVFWGNGSFNAIPLTALGFLIPTWYVLWNPATSTRDRVLWIVGGVLVAGGVWAAFKCSGTVGDAIAVTTAIGGAVVGSINAFFAQQNISQAELKRATQAAAEKAKEDCAKTHCVATEK